MSRHRSSSTKGFTLVELLISMAILGILSTATLVVINPSKRLRQARDSSRKADLRQIANALDAYYVKHGEYPHPCDRTQSEGGCSSANASTWHTDALSAVLDVLIREGYLKNLMSDPINDEFYSVWQTSGHSYFYVSEDVDLTGDDDAVAGEYYMLGAFLEDLEDPLTLDNLGTDPNDRPKWPNCLSSQTIGFDGRIFLIRSYKCPNDPEGSL